MFQRWITQLQAFPKSIHCDDVLFLVDEEAQIPLTLHKWKIGYSYAGKLGAKTFACYILIVSCMQCL